MTHSRIASKQYQGSRPPLGVALRSIGFDGVVLCENEWQPSSTEFGGILVMHCPLEDELEPVSYEDRVEVSDVARDVTRLVESGKRILVACHLGLNRSGLVNATVLMNRYGLSGAQAIREVQDRRPGALQNPFFRAALRGHGRQAALRLDRSVAL